MPELPEVEVLVRHLAPQLEGRRIRAVHVERARVVRPDGPDRFAAGLRGASIRRVWRRAKFLVFELSEARGGNRLVGHLGMTGRMYLLRKTQSLPKHAAVVFDLGQEAWVFEDTRYFGRLTRDDSVLDELGPDPLGEAFSAGFLETALRRSAQPIKVRLLDQRVAAGVGNIYASEALHRAGLSPRRAARRLRPPEVVRLHAAVREVLAEAIRFGSTVPLDFRGRSGGDGLFYYGRSAGAPGGYEERLRVYDRAGQPCEGCGTLVRRIVQAGRSAFYCPGCQR
jgi:formamidopyrimidine-DNA glycosylase